MRIALRYAKWGLLAAFVAPLGCGSSDYWLGQGLSLLELLVMTAASSLFQTWFPTA